MNKPQSKEGIRRSNLKIERHKRRARIKELYISGLSREDICAQLNLSMKVVLWDLEQIMTNKLERLETKKKEWKKKNKNLLNKYLVERLEEMQRSREEMRCIVASKSAKDGDKIKAADKLAQIAQEEYRILNTLHIVKDTTTEKQHLGTLKIVFEGKPPIRKMH